MSHPEQLAFFSLCAEANAHLIIESRVIEIGSYDVNGSIRAIFSGASEYCGIDLVDGPGVDRIMYGHEVNDPEGAWDMALSAECFEHDPHWRRTLENMVRLVRPGGLIVVSCASEGRVEHGTRRTSVIDSPGTQFEGMDYYRNVRRDDMTAMPLGAWFAHHELFYNPTSADLYLVGVRSGAREAGSQARLPARASLDHLRHLMPTRQRVVRWPVQLLRLLTRREDRFQDWAVPYWIQMTRLVAWKDRQMTWSRDATRS